MSSTHSGKYSSMNYTSGNEQDTESSFHHEKNQSTQGIVAREISSLAKELENKCSSSILLPECSRGGGISSSSSSSAGPKGCERSVDKRRLMRNRSMIDMRSQVLHRNLVEHLKKRLFKTVGAVEHIGFQNPCNNNNTTQYKASSSSKGDCRKQKQSYPWRMK